MPLMILVLLLFLVTAGCNAKTGKMSGEINMYGVQLFSDVDYKEINGITAVEEPCLRGYDRAFDQLDLVLGYGFDGRIRKITTRNAGTSIFGIKPGMTFPAGREKILQAGFVEHSPPFTFRKEGLFFTFLVDGTGKIFGVTLESTE